MKKINKNREPITSEEINQNKNFKSVLNSYYKFPKKPLYKSPKLFGAVMIIIALAVLVVIENINDREDKRNDVQHENCISPPVPSKDIEDSVYIIDPQNADTLVHPSGTRICIPADAFVDSTGKIITSEVKLTYREFRNQSEAFLSGIPMRYDSANTTTIFTTAGMFQINAWSNQKQLTLQKNKSIQVLMSSDYNDRIGFNSYNFDEQNNKWSFTGNDSSSDYLQNKAERFFDSYQGKELPSLVKAAKRLVKSTQALRSLVKEKPFQPRKLDSKKETFKVDFDIQDFPELAGFENLLFEVQDGQSIKEKDANREWTNMKIKKSKNGLNYIVGFFGYYYGISYKVLPVFAEKDFKSAYDLYEKKSKIYQDKVNQKASEEAFAASQLKAIRDSIISFAKDKIMQDSIDALDAKVRIEAIEEEQRQIILHAQLLEQVTIVFQVEGFGIFNCDRPNILPKQMNVNMAFTDANGRDLVFDKIWLVDLDKRYTIIYYQYEEGSKIIRDIKFNPAHRNRIWALKGQDLCVISEQQLMSNFTRDSDYHFQMKCTDISKLKQFELAALLQK
jgi:hypothetical protein